MSSAVDTFWSVCFEHQKCIFKQTVVRIHTHSSHAISDPLILLIFLTLTHAAWFEDIATIPIGTKFGPVQLQHSPLWLVV